MKHHQSSGKLLGVLVCASLIAVALLSIIFRLQLIDWVRVTGYTPSQEVAAITEQVGFSQTGRYFFYTGEPALADSASFTASCGAHEQSTAVLGCYTNQRIYLFAVNNNELDGIEEVTAAHEMLHAAYERLSDGKRQEVDQLLSEQMNALTGDQAFQERMKVYDGLPEAEKLNELHSVLGTEVKELSAPLETYYAQYFTRRERAAALYEQYSGVFTELAARASALADQYNQLVETRNATVEASNQEYQQLTADMAAYEQGPRSDAAQARALNARADAFNARLAEVKQQIAAYDARLRAIKAEIASIEIHTKQLNDSMDSSVTAPASEVGGG